MEGDGEMDEAVESGEMEDDEARNVTDKSGSALVLCESARTLAGEVLAESGVARLRLSGEMEGDVGADVGEGALAWVTGENAPFFRQVRMGCLFFSNKNRKSENGQKIDIPEFIGRHPAVPGVLHRPTKKATVDKDA